MATHADGASAAVAADYRRRPWLAVLLSLVMCGLGHIYCGRIVKGLVLLLVGGLLGPVAVLPLAFGNADWAYHVLLVCVLLMNAVWLYAIVDALLSARRAAVDYRLKDYNRWYVYALLVLLTIPTATGFALLTREGVCEAFMVAAESMNPTLKLGDRVLADKRIYRFEPVDRGDIVVFISPNKRHQCWIKRVVGLPDDTIQLRENELYVNGKSLKRSKSSAAGGRIGVDPAGAEVLWEENGSARYRILLAERECAEIPRRQNVPETTVPPGHCYVLGDNRNCSRDSRHVGPIPLVDVVGRVDYLYFPKLGRLRP